MLIQNLVYTHREKVIPKSTHVQEFSPRTRGIWTYKS